MSHIESFNTLISCIKCEYKKLKSPALWSGIIGIPILSVFLGSGNYVINASAFSGGSPWFHLWTQVALFYGYFFYPLLISVIASYLWRVEHQHNNWNALFTSSIPLSYYWFSKLFVLAVYAVICQILIVFFYTIAGFILKLPGSIPDVFWWWIVGGSFSILAPASIQLYLSMRIKSFALPTGLCFIFCILGLGAYTKGWWMFPYTLSIIGVGAQHDFLPSPLELIEVFFGVVFWVVLFSTLAVMFLERKDL